MPAAAAAPAKTVSSSKKSSPKPKPVIDTSVPLKKIAKPLSSWSETVGSTSKFHQRPVYVPQKDGGVIKRYERILKMSPDRKALFRSVPRSVIVKLMKQVYDYNHNSR